MATQQTDYQIMEGTANECTPSNEPSLYLSIVLCIVLVCFYLSDVGVFFVEASLLIYPIYFVYQLIRLFLKHNTLKTWRWMKIGIWGFTITLGIMLHISNSAYMA